jgi:magnesium transporter
MDAMGSDVQADMIGNMEEVEAEAILSQMGVEDAADVRRLSEYEEDTAGGLMQTEVFKFHDDQTVGDVLRQVISGDEDFDRYRGQHPYILDSEGRPVGVVSLRGLLTAKRSAPLTSIMVKPLTVDVTTTLSELEDIFDKYPFLGVPVVDEAGKLVGVVSRSAVAEALLERAEIQTLKRQGVVGDELRSMPTWLRSRRRLAWLSANIVLNIIAASVISAYEETLKAVIAIAIFLPMVSDMSGCSGNQAVGVTLRELSLGLVRPIDVARVWLKEIQIGVINGIALGILIGIVAWIWKGNPMLGLVIGLALALNTMLAVSIGGVVPLFLKRLGQDPAAASGPLLTTVTDMAGFFLVLSLATVMMPWLLQ